MVQDDIGGIPHVKGAFSCVIIQTALAKSHVDNDNVVLVTRRDFASHDTNTGSWGGRAIDGQVTGQRDGGLELDVASHVEDDNASGLTDCIAE